jgi:methyltransferase (TIGR00027 family)
MIDGRESETAMAAAMLRAAHQVVDSEPRILDDPISVGLVPGSSTADLEEARDRLASPFMRTLRSSFVLRSAIAEQALFRAVASGARQTVLIGAGFDTFAFRQPEWAAKLTIFEVDHPATQAAKRSFLKSAGHSFPENLRFCPADLESVDLTDVLMSAEFEPSLPTFFSWLGVIPYLSSAAIDSTIRALGQWAAGHSIALSFVLPDSRLSGDDALTASIASAASAKRGEPWVSRHLKEEMDLILREHGYTSVEHFGPNEYATLLTSERPDGLTSPSFERVVVAHSSVRAV